MINMTDKTYGDYTLSQLKQLCNDGSTDIQFMIQAVPDLIAEIERLEKKCEWIDGVNDLVKDMKSAGADFSEREYGFEE